VKYKSATEALSVLLKKFESKMETAETRISKEAGEPNGKIGKLDEEIGKKLDKKIRQLDEKIGKLDKKMVRKLGEKFRNLDKGMDDRFNNMGIKHSSESKELSEKMTQFYGVCSELSRKGEAANLSSESVCLFSFLFSLHPYSGMVAMPV